MRESAHSSRPGARGEIVSRFFMLSGRLLLLLTALALLVMPWTEYFWHFDHFLRGGGQDFELNIIAVMSVLCLVLILLQHGKRCVVSILWLGRLLGFLDGIDSPVLRQTAYGEGVARNKPVTLPEASAIYTLPIQV